MQPILETVVGFRTSQYGPSRSPRRGYPRQILCFPSWCLINLLMGEGESMTWGPKGCKHDSKALLGSTRHMLVPSSERSH